MAEYITIMIINNKTAAQITSELEDLIGSDFDPSFTDWLFVEAAKGAPESEVVPQSTSTTPSVPQATPTSPKPTSLAQPPASSSSVPDQRRPPNAPRGSTGAPLYQQALSSALPSHGLGHGHGYGQKRTASVRSPSPTGHGPAKTRRTDLPTGPRAMLNNGGAGGGGSSAGGPGGGRSLLDRVGGRNNNAPNAFGRADEIQARIDAVTNNTPNGALPPDPSMMMGFPPGGVPGMDMNGMGGAAPNAMMLQEMMMNQMALMAQMASSMGMLNPATGQMMSVGAYPGMGQQGDMGMFNGNGGPMNGGGFMQGQGQAQGGVNGRGRGGGRGGRGRGGASGRGGQFGSSPAPSSETQNQPSEPAATPSAEPTVPIVAPTPTPASSSSQHIPYALPERPQSPTLCKFGTKCTNSQCRYSHPSPVATAESGVVLSTEACEKGKDCKDKDCIKAHVSPAVNTPGAEHQKPPSAHPAASHPHPSSHPSNSSTNAIPCRFGSSCTRPNCTYSHPTTRPSSSPSQNPHFAQQCRFGASCTRATCPFQHPDGRVLPTSFHRGLSTSSPMVSVHTPETGSIGGSVHRSVTFNNAGKADKDGVKEKLEKQMRELEATKKAVEEAEAAAAATGGKKEETKAVPIAV
ncbi:hypothetical protein HYDPIDRAFT_110012 [Hydnomerulius pinastri MD-312]|nr:hypothetical protein HYDPIDRAFT_110012 [Hydnomerulius pinastri MD-312]